jgi:hypothetical protein
MAPNCHNFDGLPQLAQLQRKLFDNYLCLQMYLISGRARRGPWGRSKNMRTNLLPNDTKAVLRCAVQFLSSFLITYIKRTGTTSAGTQDDFFRERGPEERHEGADMLFDTPTLTLLSICAEAEVAITSLRLRWLPERRAPCLHANANQP